MKMWRDALGSILEMKVWKFRIDVGNHFFGGWFPNFHKCGLGDGWSIFHRWFSVHYFRSGLLK